MIFQRIGAGPQAWSFHAGKKQHGVVMAVPRRADLNAPAAMSGRFHETGSYGTGSEITGAFFRTALGQKEAGTERTRSRMKKFLDKSVSGRGVRGGRAVCCGKIQRRAVYVGHLSDIAAAFGPSFELERGRSHADDVVHPSDETQIHGGPYGAEVLSLRDGQEGTVVPDGLFHGKGDSPVFKAAGLRAESEIGRSLIDPCGNEAVPGKGKTHGSVNEHLQVHGGKTPDEFGHGVPAEFPRQIDALYAVFLPELHGGGVDGMGLCGKMQFHGRAELSGKTYDSGIGCDESVYAKLRQLFQLFFHKGQLLVIRKSVQTVVDADAGAVCEGYGVFQRLAVKAPAFCAKGKGASAEIYGVGSIEYRGLKLLPASGRREQFRQITFRHGHGIKVKSYGSTTWSVTG